MFNVTIKNLRGHARRMISTCLAVFLGVSFLCGTVILGNTITKTFKDLIGNVYSGTDAYVRSATSIKAGEGGSGFSDRARPRLPDTLIATVRGVPGVGAAEGSVNGTAIIEDKDGNALGSGGRGAPSLGGNWQNTPDLNTFQLAEGGPPTKPDDVVIDRSSAKTAKFNVGDPVTIEVQQGPRQFHISGIAKFGNQDSPGGATYALFTLPTAQAVIAQPGKVDAVVATAAAGVSQAELQSRIQKVMPGGVEVLTGTQITKENQDSFQKRISGFGTVLSAFAWIALIVAGFVIFNTFGILFAQRAREMALLRAVGATRRQVLVSVLGESLSVGLLASVLGIIGGVVFALALRALFGAVGFGFPDGSLVISVGTIVLGLIVGTVVTLVSALMPAIRASRVPPLAALRDVAVDTSGASRKRVVAGIIVLTLGVVAAALGVAGKSAGPIGLGAVATLVGMVIIGPVIARPTAWVIGSPAPRFRGMPGVLARDNAVRNPRRTAGTGSALMVGIAIIAFFVVLASSVKKTTDNQIARSFVGDLTVSAGLGGGPGLSPSLANEVAKLPTVAAVAPFRFASAEIAGSSEGLASSDTAALPKLLDIGVTSGQLDTLSPRQVAVLSTTAKNHGWKVGDTVPITFAETGPQPFTIGAIYTRSDIAGNYLISTAAYDANIPNPKDQQVFVKLKGGVDPTTARSQVQTVATKYPPAKVQDEQQLKKAFSSAINQVLALIFGMLALAVVIALIGISNTLQLSVYERTRELGLLRAVGMTRRQLRSSVRLESTIVALFGTIGGLALGSVFGWAIVHGLGRDNQILFALPIGTLIVILIVGGLVGITAAVRPASRAAKLDILAAIATE